MMAPAAGLRHRVRPLLFRTGAALMGTAAIALTGALLTGCSGAPSARDVASNYLTDWANRDWPAMRALVARPPASFTAVNAAALSDLGVTRASYAGGRVEYTFPALVAGTFPASFDRQHQVKLADSMRIYGPLTVSTVFLAGSGP